MLPHIQTLKVCILICKIVFFLINRIWVARLSAVYKLYNWGYDAFAKAGFIPLKTNSLYVYGKYLPEE